LQLSPPGVSPRVSPRESTQRRKVELWARNVPVILPKCRKPRYIWGSFTCRKATTWDRRLYFPSEGRRAEDFFRPKNPAVSAWCEPANLGTKGQQATCRPPKPLRWGVGCKRYPPASLTPQKTYCIGGLVGPRAGLDGCVKFSSTTGIRSPDRPARGEVLYRLDEDNKR